MIISNHLFIFITELTFVIQGKSYICVAFANPPYAFIRPPIFDDIFADELALIANINKDGKVTTDEAHKFFKKISRTAYFR